MMQVLHQSCPFSKNHSAFYSSAAKHMSILSLMEVQLFFFFFNTKWHRAVNYGVLNQIISSEAWRRRTQQISTILR